MYSRNIPLLSDYYEYSMANGYVERGHADDIVYFDYFFRRSPDDAGFAITAGLEQVIDYIQNLRFTDSDIEFLRSKNVFGDKFLERLRNFKFSGDMYAMPEGAPVFPGEPIITIRATAFEAQLLETFLLLTMNHQSLIATKAHRIVRAPEGRAVSEFGSRRAQGTDAAIMGARAAYIAGCTGTACTVADKYYGVPASGTMAHSWVQLFDSEYDAFKAYCELYPDNASLLVDTYNTLKSGVPNAIRAFKEILVPRGIRNFAIRLDSGDIPFLTMKARHMLDEAGLKECKIIVSNSLDEWLIRELLTQGARVDAFGVGEKLITSRSDPVFNGVYKMVAVEKDGEIVPKIKISDNSEKITTPHFKKVYRLFDGDGKATADLICLHDEVIDASRPLELFDPDVTWKRKAVENFTAKELMVPIFKDGELVYKCPELGEIREYCKNQLDTLWDEVKRFSFPHVYYVDLSERLWTIRQGLLQNHRH